MLKSIETQGVTRDDAIRKALEQLGMDRDSVSVEVLDNGKKGFLGIGVTPARIRVTYEVPDEVQVKKPVAPQEKREEKPRRAPATKPSAERAAVSIKPSAERAAVFIKPSAEKATAYTKPQEEKVIYTPKKPLAEAEIPLVGKEATAFVDGLLEKLGVEGHAVVTEDTTAEAVQIEIIGPDMGAVIGRRGDTLDAIQYLASLVANREQEEHTRITIDTENYRAKREESLRRLAYKMANKVIKYHKNMTLEPMNPYERRIIHAALQDFKGVTTYSTGTEPGRRVVIAPEGSGRGGYSQRYSSGR